MPTAARVRAGRKAVERLERDVARAKARLEKARRRAPPEPVADYAFAGWDGRPLTLAQAFGRKEDLLVVHNMGASCPYCTLWADGLEGVREHLEDRAAFLVVSQDPVRRQKAFARARGWRFAMASARGTTFFRDMGFVSKDGDPWPGVSAFHRDGRGRIVRTGRASFGPGDDFSPVFGLLPLLAGGVADWSPKFRYRARARP